MGRAVQLAESARLPAYVHGINNCGRGIFHAGDRRTNRRQTADDIDIRRRLVNSLHIKDFAVAVCEDVVAVGLALFLVWQ
jgi:hypothetical protein